MLQLLPYQKNLMPIPCHVCCNLTLDCYYIKNSNFVATYIAYMPICDSKLLRNFKEHYINLHVCVIWSIKGGGG